MLLFFFSCGDTDSVPKADHAVDVKSQIQAAGNAVTDAERLEILESTYLGLEANTALKEDFDRLLPVIDQWVYGLESYWGTTEQNRPGEDGYLCDFFVLNTWPSDWGNIYPPPIDEDSELYPIWSIYRGRMLIWTAIENNFLPELYFEEGLGQIELASRAFPENKVLKMYLGEPIPWSPPSPSTAFPSWAQNMHISLKQMAEITAYWIEVRQAPDGQFGGGWGDDVEIWRQWTPLLLGISSPSVVEAQVKLATGIFSLDRMAESYTEVLSDVEHSSEESSDPLTLMLQLYPNDPIWTQHSEAILGHWDGYWLHENQYGFEQFPSTYFTPNEIHQNPNYACDTLYHTRAIQPILLQWQNTGDPVIGEIVSRWLDTWVDISSRESNGKASGVIPSAIHYPSGEAGGPDGDWWDPGCHYSNTTYQWPRAFGLMSRALLMGYHESDNEEYLTPLRSMAELRLRYIRGEFSDSEPEGSEGWVAKELGSKLKDVLGKGYLLGWREHDEVLQHDAGPYMHFILTGNSDPLEASLAESVQALSQNKEAYTSEVRFTDRIMKFHSKFLSVSSGLNQPSVDSTLLYEMLTGDIGDPNILPLPAVRWTVDPNFFVAWVSRQSETEFEADIGNFSESPLAVDARFMRLQSTVNLATLECEDGTVSQQSLSDNSLSIQIPPSTMCRLGITESDK